MIDLTWQNLKFNPDEQIRVPLRPHEKGKIYTIEHDFKVRSFDAQDYYCTSDGYIPIIEIWCDELHPMDAGQKVCDKVQEFKKALLDAVGIGPGIRKYVMVVEDICLGIDPKSKLGYAFGDFGFAIYERKRRKHEGIPQHSALSNPA